MLIVGLILSLQIPAVQNFVKDKAINYLEGKLDTEVSLEKIYVDFPNDIVLQNFYLKGKDVDTLLFVNQLNVGIYLPDLIKSQANISSINLDGVNATINRDAEGKFNFDFILDAFATENDEDKDSKPFIISLNKIDLKNIDVNFNDDISKNFFKIRLNHFQTKVETFDLIENNYAINSILIDGFKFKLDQKVVDKIVATSEVQADSVSDSKPLKIQLGNIQLKNFDVSYLDENSKMNAHVIFEDLNTNIKKIDLIKNAFEVDKVNLSNATIDFSMFSQPKTTVVNEVKKTDSSDLSFMLNQLKLNNVAVNYNENSVKETNQGVDFNHLKFSKIDFELSDFVFNNSAIYGKIDKVFLHEKSGFQVNEFSTEFKYAEKTAYLKEMILKTPKSIIRDEVVLEYNSQDDLTQNIENVKIYANLPNAKIAFSDILLLVPTLKNTPPFNEYANAILNVDSKLNGKVNDLQIQKLLVSGLGNVKVNASGNIKNAMELSNLWVDLRLNEFVISASDLNKLVPKGTIPNTIQLPNQLDLKGNAKGSLNNFLADLKLHSTFGNIDLKAVLNQQKKNAETYVLDAKVSDFNVGKLIKNDLLGKISATMKLSGKSFDLEKADAVIAAHVSSAKFNSYTYKDFKLNGKIEQGAFDVSTTMNDENIIFDISAIGHYSEKAPSLNLKGDVTKIDLYRTGFFDETFALAGKISADFSNLNPNELNGNLSLHDFALAYKTGLYPLTNVTLDAISNDEKNQIQFQSQVFNIDLTGKYKLTELATHLQRNVNSYFNLNLPEEVLKQELTPAYFDATILVKNDDILSKFLPDLERFKDIELTGSFNSEQNKISIQSKISELIYGENVISGIDVNIENQDDFLDYNFSISGLENNNFHLQNTSLTGQIKDNKIGYDLRVRDLENVIQYEISGNVSSLNDVIQVALNDNGLKLNYVDWNVNPANYFQISDKGILAHDFEISHDGSLIHIDSEEDIPNAPLNIDIKDFTIETVTEMIKKDTLLASGIINGKAQINDLKNKMTFTSDLNVQKLNVLGSNVGNLKVNVDNESDSRLSANIALSGYDNDVQALGFYDISEEKFDLEVDVNQLQMRSLQAFSQQMISDAKGFISGQLNITGNTEKPSILGDIKFNDTSLHINSLNATFKKIDDKITFTNDGISFNNFSISDTDDNVLTLNGNVLTKTYRDFKFDLTLFGQGFKLVNSANSGDDMLYGVAALDVNLTIKGNMNLPRVNGNLKVTNQTDFTFVMPQYSPALQEREGIIEFIDQDQLVLEETIVKDEEITNSEITGLDVSVNIEVDKDAKIAIVLDKINNDVVKIQGEAQLTGGIDPSGKTTLVGTYEVNQGTYDMSVNFIKRKFDIQKGSTIVWNGEPTKADVNLTAIYKLKTAPLDLVQQQLTSDATQDINLYKQKLPFETLLIIKGELMKPEISFNIELDEDNSNVSSEVLSTVKSKLEQLRNEESELNKQVLALLILNRFIGENPFDTNVNISASSMARQSVSKLLSQQLNSLASSLISGVDINFDLESQDDYSTGDKNVRTDLNIGVSKSLFHDRLKVTVGSNFGLEGENRENEQTNNIAGDVTIEYKLSKNGRYTLRAYRVNEYQVALQGEVVETGLGFVITLDYNKFKEILKNKNNEKKNQSNSTKKANNESK
ncbi:translocation/assembly module TamB [Flavobacterium sp. I3-2]|uniref:translocation/assembly module TamB domain-containing protein n=1 Tax=Flavobacterium sp. I3-2 TaxID=2748319 RepID=UPI0021031D41|nr:translocation/assembly module TamB [Flavobacterium sp. I3-2]